MPSSVNIFWTAYGLVSDNRRLGLRHNKAIADAQHNKAIVDASLISVIAVYGNKEEQPRQGFVT